MGDQNIRRRRGGVTTATSSTAEQISASEPKPQTEAFPPPKSTVSEVIAEHTKSLTNYLGFALLVCFGFLYMIRTTELPPPHRVYAVMIDAGSTGTRAQVFMFRHNQTLNRLVLDDTKVFTTKRNLATLAAADPKASTAFFSPLLDKIKSVIPGGRRRQATPISLRATGGLRLIGPELAENALTLSRMALNASEFLFQENWLSVLSESEEANHAWTTVNFLLGNLDSDSNMDDTDYVGALDLGGASMQAVFRHEGDIDVQDGTGEIDQEQVKEIPYPAMKSRVELFGKLHTLHSRSHLGLGLFDFTKKLYSIFEREGVLEEGNPCFRKSKVFENKHLRLGVPGSEEVKTVTMTGDGDFGRCVASAEIVINSFSSFNDKRSRLPPRSKFYAFAYFYDRTVKFGLPKRPTREELAAKGKELCETSPNVWVEGDFDEACAEFSYIYAVMKIFTNDFSKSDDIEVRFEQYVGRHMLGWALGAVLEMLQPVMHRQLELENKPLLKF